MRLQKKAAGAKDAFRLTLKALATFTVRARRRRRPSLQLGVCVPCVPSLCCSVLTDELLALRQHCGSQVLVTRRPQPQA